MGKRIAIVIDSLVGGGAEKVMLVLAETLQLLGHEPHFILIKNNRDHTVSQSLPIHVCFNDNERNIDSFWKINKSVIRLERLIKSLEKQHGSFDLFISNLDRSQMLMSKLSLHNSYFVIHNALEGALIKSKKMGPIKYWKALRVNKALTNKNLITVSKGIETEIETTKIIKSKMVQTIYNPFDFDKINLLSSIENELIPKQDFMIHVGRCAKEKRHDILFKALAKMENNLPLVLLCKNKNKAFKLAKKYGVEDRVIMPGFHENPYSWIKKAKLLILSSDYEGLPTVLIESLAVGTPVVSTDCRHGPGEILTNEFAGFLVPRRSPIELAKKVDLALTQYPDCSQADILNKVQAQVVAQKYIDLIE